MTLTRGQKLGHYQIVEAIGAGGMGEVYRAHDTRLGRDVAVKVLPDGVASDPSRLARFELAEPSLNKIFIDLVGPEAATPTARSEAVDRG